MTIQFIFDRGSQHKPLVYYYHKFRPKSAVQGWHMELYFFGYGINIDATNFDEVWKRMLQKFRLVLMLLLTGCQQPNPPEASIQECIKSGNRPEWKANSTTSSFDCTKEPR